MLKNLEKIFSAKKINKYKKKVVKCEVIEDIDIKKEVLLVRPSTLFGL